ncbi:transglycosylase domain-containing protein [Pseudoruegeria sp. SK021]|uniref:transglycosylase domain-containing protein n=1 Tax=Pseudoruegeria sp. SK021 TaxID=1933035 RepID=UPI000A23485D|nr:PBP1A family penicillin-binding protein [Pseudoruegeria sp. SK021]OSP54181.1 glycosyl transferase [Pseudoruegeria sp. SK021]
MSRPPQSKRPLVAEKRYAKPQASAAKPARATAKVAAAPTTKRPRKPSSATQKRQKGGRSRGGSGGGSGGLFGIVGRLVRWIMRKIWAVTWRIGLVSGAIVGGAVMILYSDLPDASELVDQRARGSVTMMDRYGDVFAWRGDQFGGVITTDTVSPNLKNAIIATEDRRFYSHFGVSPRGVLGAIAINLREGRGALEGHGGSTITQQTAKLLCVGTPYDPSSGISESDYEAECRRGSISRKVHEALYALAMEVRYTKDEILTIYMNRAYLGAGTRGFEAASQRYFGKSAAEVDPAEAAMLAGLLVAPSRYAPTTDLERSRDRAETIIGLMQEQDFLTFAEAERARGNPAELSEAAEARAGGYFADWIMSTAPSFLAGDTTEDVLISTTFDKRIQRAAEAGLETVFDNKIKAGSKAQAAIVVMGADGAIRAMVGGRKTKVAGSFNRATQALRQTGSAFKPFIYATALELGYGPNDMVNDAPLTINVPGSGPWTPQNYTRRFEGQVTLTKALEQSLNIPAVKVSESVGRENVRRVARDFGIRNSVDSGPALALGTSEATLLEMTAAYAGILNGGSSVTPYGLTDLRLIGDNESLIDQDGGIGERVISEQAARELVWMMYQVVEHGTGTRARLDGREVAGKTGTTSAARDAWFIGFTADYVTGVWMGYDDNTPLTGTTGAGLPAEIWHETMARVQDGLPAKPLPMTPPVAPMREMADTPSDNGGGTTASNGTTRNAAPTQQTGNGSGSPLDLAERVLNDVLGLFRKSN